MTFTKLLPSTLTTGDHAPRDHLIPQLDAYVGAGFCGVRTGRRFESGVITYLGEGVDAAEILARVQQRGPLPGSREACLARLEQFFHQLGELRLGNVVSIRYRPDGSFELVKEAERPPSDPPAPLP